MRPNGDPAGEFSSPRECVRIGLLAGRNSSNRCMNSSLASGSSAIVRPGFSAPARWQSLSLCVGTGLAQPHPHEHNPRGHTVLHCNTPTGMANLDDFSPLLESPLHKCVTSDLFYSAVFVSTSDSLIRDCSCLCASPRNGISRASHRGVQAGGCATDGRREEWELFERIHRLRCHGNELVHLLNACRDLFGPVFKAEAPFPNSVVDASHPLIITDL